MLKKLKLSLDLYSSFKRFQKGAIKILMKRLPRRIQWLNIEEPLDKEGTYLVPKILRVRRNLKEITIKYRLINVSKLYISSSSHRE